VDGTLEVPNRAMPPPGLLTGNLAVGLVNVPIRLYTATRTEGIAYLKGAQTRVHAAAW
jgi:non-homologous end joining protein Ku